MKHKTVVLVLGALLFVASVAADEGDVKRIFPYDTQVETLENGLKVILIPMSSDGLVAYWSIVRTGSRDEYEPGHTGFAHFFEHMMFRGTEKFPADVYNEIITEMGADANAFTTDDLTAYHMGVAAEDLERVMEIESDRFMNLAYPESAFRTEAGAVYGEYRKNRMSPFFTMIEAIQQEAFRTHTYGHTTMGYEADIKAMPTMYEYSRSFFARYYRPENVVLLIAGDIEPSGTMELARRYYGAWERGYTAPDVQAEPDQDAQRSLEVAYEGRSLPLLALAYKSDRFDPANRRLLSAMLLAELAFGSTSEIYKKLVLDEQVVEFVTADQEMTRDPGLFSIFTRIKDPQKVDYVLEEIDRTVEHFRNNPPDAARLEALRSRLKYQFLMRLDTPDRVASSLARIVALTGGIAAVDEMYRGYEEIGPEEIREAAVEYLAASRRTVAVLRGKK